MSFSAEDDTLMQAALELAREAAAAGEVPVGAVAAAGGQAVASARNRVEERHSVTAHAEIELLHELERLRGDWRMDDVTIYVTKEPCAMCAGALVNARVGRIVFGLADPRCGGCGSSLDITGHPGMLWHPAVEGGLRSDEAGRIIREFFKRVRKGD
ncbi:MAG: nucleoside deaminase [Victivallaceae bacterium]|nr:nucleoside deaminase [Victivallaceae bacterium]